MAVTSHTDRHDSDSAHFQNIDNLGNILRRIWCGYSLWKFESYINSTHYIWFIG